MGKSPRKATVCKCSSHGNRHSGRGAWRSWFQNRLQRAAGDAPRTRSGGWTLTRSLSLLTDGPVRSSIRLVRGLLRVLVVGFTVVSFLIVAAVGVSASSGKVGSSNTLKNSVVAVFSGHVDQTGFHEGTTNTDNTNSNNNDRQGGHKGDECKPPKKHHKHVTGDHENDRCGGDDSGSD